jgi:hypothetical protein
MSKAVVPSKQFLFSLVKVHVAARHRRSCGGKGMGNILLNAVRVGVTDREIAARVNEDFDGSTSCLGIPVAT